VWVVVAGERERQVSGCSRRQDAMKLHHQAASKVQAVYRGHVAQQNYMVCQVAGFGSVRVGTKIRGPGLGLRF